MDHSKKKSEGRAERQEVLKSVFHQSQEVMQEALGDPSYRGRVAKHDILDALSAAVTGLADRNGLDSLPNGREFDAHGLPMEMVFRRVQ